MNVIIMMAAYCGYGSWEPCGQEEPGLFDGILATTGGEVTWWVLGGGAVLLLLGILVTTVGGRRR